MKLINAILLTLFSLQLHASDMYHTEYYDSAYEEKADGVTCFYTQTSVMKSQCGLANKSGMFIALTAAERSTSIQAALAEYIAQDAKTANAATAFARPAVLVPGAGRGPVSGQW